jgi:hypothetical protein
MQSPINTQGFALRELPTFPQYDPRLFAFDPAVGQRLAGMQLENQIRQRSLADFDVQAKQREEENKRKVLEFDATMQDRAQGRVLQQAQIDEIAEGRKFRNEESKANREARIAAQEQAAEDRRIAAEDRKLANSYDKYFSAADGTLYRLLPGGGSELIKRADTPEERAENGNLLEISKVGGKLGVSMASFKRPDGTFDSAGFTNAIEEAQLRRTVELQNLQTAFSLGFTDPKEYIKALNSPEGLEDIRRRKQAITGRTEGGDGAGIWGALGGVPTPGGTPPPAVNLPEVKQDKDLQGLLESGALAPGGKYLRDGKVAILSQATYDAWRNAQAGAGPAQAQITSLASIPTPAGGFSIPRSDMEVATGLGSGVLSPGSLVLRDGRFELVSKEEAGRAAMQRLGASYERTGMRINKEEDLLELYDLGMAGIGGTVLVNGEPRTVTDEYLKRLRTKTGIKQPAPRVGT